MTHEIVTLSLLMVFVGAAHAERTFTANPEIQAVDAETSAAAVAARPLTETRRIMKENAYVGVWEERHQDEVLQLGFMTNAFAVLDYRGRRQLFRWKADGKGDIRFALPEEPGKPVAQVRYLADQDIMDLGFEGKTTQLDFTGRAAFKSIDVPAEMVGFIPVALARRERFREERFERLKKSGDKRFMRAEGLKDIFDPKRLHKNRQYAETVDLEYPQIITYKMMGESFMAMEVLYGSRGGKRIKQHEFRNWRKALPDMPAGENDIGIRREVAEKAMASLAQIGIESRLKCYEYGEGRKKWREEGLSFNIYGKQLEVVGEILNRYFGDDRPRYVYVDKVEYYHEEKIERMEQIGEAAVKGYRKEPCVEISDDSSVRGTPASQLGVDLRK